MHAPYEASNQHCLGSKASVFLANIINHTWEGHTMEVQKSGEAVTSKIRIGGTVLFLASFMLWLYRHDLHPVNYIIVVLIIFRAVEYAVSKTSLFVKKIDDLESPSIARRAITVDSLR